jgi:hypothetical protein
MNTFDHMCGTIDPGSCIRRVLGFVIKTGYDKFRAPAELHMKHQQKAGSPGGPGQEGHDTHSWGGEGYDNFGLTPTLALGMLRD